MAKNFKDRFKILDLEANFPFWKDLRELYYKRYILVHKLGIIDNKFPSILGKNEKEVGERI